MRLAQNLGNMLDIGKAYANVSRSALLRGWNCEEVEPSERLVTTTPPDALRAAFSGSDRRMSKSADVAVKPFNRVLRKQLPHEFYDCSGPEIINLSDLDSLANAPPEVISLISEADDSDSPPSTIPPTSPPPTPDDSCVLECAIWCDVGLRFLKLRHPWREALDLTATKGSQQPAPTMHMPDPLPDGPNNCTQTLRVSGPLASGGESCSQTMRVPDRYGYDCYGCVQDSQETCLYIGDFTLGKP